MIRFRLDDLLGSFLKSAAELAAIGAWIPLRLSLAIPQSQVSKVSLNRGEPLDIYLPGRNFVLGGSSYRMSSPNPDRADGHRKGVRWLRMFVTSTSQSKTTHMTGRGPRNLSNPLLILSQDRNMRFEDA